MTIKLPSGPDIPFDLNMTEESFPKVAEYIKTYGDYSLIKPVSRSNNTVLINDPDGVKHILVKNHENYVKGPGFERVKMLLGNGIIVSDGAYWRKQRRMIQPAFSRKHIESFTNVMQSVNNIWVKDWQKKAENEDIVDITDEMSRLSLEIILRCLFGDDLDKLIHQQGENPFSILTDDLTRDMQLVIRFRALKKLVQQLINERRETDKKYYDFLDAFINADEKDSNKGMSDEEIIDEVMTLIIAGHETSANTLNWVWYELSQNKEVENKFHDEIERVASGDVPAFDELANLKYCKQIIEETLRLYPPVWLYSRTALEDDNVGGYDIPAGTNVFFTPYFIHRHTQHWSEPEQFNPANFSEEQVKNRHKFAFIAFSAGARRCIGDYFSIVEMQIHLATMAKKFRLECVDTNIVELDPQVNLRTKYNLMVKIIKR